MSVQSPGRQIDPMLRWSAVLPELWLALRRFPLPALFPIVFAAYYLFGGDAVLALPASLTPYLGWELFGAFLWTLAIAIWAEAAGRSWWDRLLANAIGLAVIIVLLSGTRVLHTSPALLIMTLALSLSLAAHHGLEPQNDAFWLYNQRLWTGAGTALIGGFVVVMGLMAVAGSIEYLFDFRMPDGLYTKIWILAMGLLAPLHWLTMIPARFDALGDDEDGDDFGLGAWGLLARYIFVPVMLVFTLVLYRYAFKIFQDGQVPPGRLGPVVLAYTLLGMAAFILCYPLRDKGGALVRSYWRFWFAFSIVPTALLVVSAYIRIDAFGLTEARYVLALLAAWLAILSAAFLVLRITDLRLIPASLGALLIVGSFGPSGATGLSLRSQTDRLARILEANGLLAANKLNTKPAAEIKLRRGDDVAIRSILEFLGERGELARLEPWFKGTPANPFNQEVAAGAPVAAGGTATGRGREIGRAVSAALGVPMSPIGARPSRTVVFYARHPKVVPTAGASRMAGPIHLSLGPSATREIATIALGTGRDLAVMLDQRVLVVEDKAGRRAVFDLVAVARKIPWFENRKALVPALTAPLTIKPTGREFDVRLVLTSLQGQRAANGNYAFTQLSCWLLLYGK